MQEASDDLSEILIQVIAVAARRRWWLLLPSCGVALATTLVSMMLPNRYRSEAMILVERQKVPERYVVPNTTIDMREALQDMTQAILSRTRLLQIIDEFGLYPKERKRLGQDELIGLMRNNIEIEPAENSAGGRPAREGINAFMISFTGDTPRQANEVAGRLTSVFIEENLRTREQQDIGTTKFLGEQLEAARKDLEKQEQNLRDFKMRNLGQLPEQQQGNLQILGGLHMQLQNTVSALARAQQQRTYLESLLNQYHSMAVAGNSVTGSRNASPLEAAQAELVRLQREREALLARYTAEYPEVQKIDEQITQTKATLQQLMEVPKESGEGKPKFSHPPASDLERDSTTAQIRSQLEANRLEIASAVSEQKRLAAQIADYQQRLNLTPVREQQLADVLRNYDLSKQNYADLLSKKTQSELATSLQKRQQGQQFRIIDAPSMPSKPFSPKRVKIVLGGMAAGIGLGVALALFAEAQDHSFRDENDIRQQFKNRLVLAVPLMLSPAEKRTLSRKRVLQWAAASALVVVVLATEFYVFRKG